MQQLERLLAELEDVRPSGEGWTARCPCPKHGRKGRGDARPSLSIGIGEEGKILVHCYGGCTTDAVLEAVGLELADLFPKDDDDSVVAVSPSKPKVVRSADADLCHKVYSALLQGSTLTDDHRRRLRARGLDDETIDRNGYRSLVFFPFKKLIGRLREEFGERLLQVPGFIDKNGTVAAVETPGGILVPVRDVQRRTVALQIRLDDPGDSGKYRWFSGGAVGSGSPVHVPLGVEAAKVVRVTEGALKADVVFALSKTPTLGFGGVAQAKTVLPVLQQLGAKTVLLAFDADSQTNPNVADAQRACRDALTDYRIELETWRLDQGKGLDDLLAAGGKPKRLTGKQANQVIDALLQKEEDAVPDKPAMPSTVEEPSPTASSLRGPLKFPYGGERPAPFPNDFFPKPLQDVVHGVSRASNCPPDFVGCAMLVVAATAVGRSRQIEALEGWHVCPRLYLGLVGDPGSGKTPAIHEATAPLWQKESAWREDHRRAKDDHDNALLDYEVLKKEYVNDVRKTVQEAKKRTVRRSPQETDED